jgi:hypothetical protein
MIIKPDLLKLPRVRLRGRVDKIQVLEKGIIVKEYDGFDNLVLDAGLNLVATNPYANLSRACCIGTGNTAPAVGQSLLTAEVARTLTMVTGAGNCGTTTPNPYTYIFKRTYDFALGALNGNYSELGFSPNSGVGQTLFSRVLIQVSGVPTAITVTSAQQLRVVYSLTVSFGPIVDTPFSINFGGGWGLVNGVCKMQNIVQQIRTVDTSGAASGLFGASLEGSGGGYFFVSSDASALAAVGSSVARAELTGGGQYATPSGYVAGTFQRDSSVVFSVTQGNGVIRSFGLGVGSSGSPGAHGFGFVMDAPQTKPGTNTLTFGFRVSWGR